jgi:hypothetical protein
MVWWLWIIAALVALAVLKHRLYKKDQVTVQHPWPTKHFPAVDPGNGAPLFAGIRVVEMSSVVAAPVRHNFPTSLLWPNPLKVQEQNGLCKETEIPRGCAVDCLSQFVGLSMLLISLSVIFAVLEHSRFCSPQPAQWRVEERFGQPPISPSQPQQAVYAPDILLGV